MIKQNHFLEIIQFDGVIFFEKSYGTFKNVAKHFSWGAREKNSDKEGPEVYTWLSYIP